ncbi:MAG: SMP-30/gluconolactonase/LRE family protein [Rhizobiales bacterium]|nr:SMP-30/gluconolactonase/LRE family protein [Hyphomicrobiales bacterium]
MEIDLPVREVLAADSLLGEGVLWDAARSIVWFVDIKRHRLWHYDPATGSNAFTEAPDQIGWAIPAEGGLLLCGLKDGLYTFDPEAERFDKLGRSGRTGHQPPQRCLHRSLGPGVVRIDG